MLFDDLEDEKKLVLFQFLLKKPIGLEDLAELSPTEGRSLQQLLDYDGEDFEEVCGEMCGKCVGPDTFGSVPRCRLNKRGIL